MKAGQSLGLKVKAVNRLFKGGAVLLLSIWLAACSAAMDNSNSGADAPRSGNNAASESIPQKGEISKTGSDAAENKAIEPAPPKERENRPTYTNPNQEQQAGQLTAGEWDDLSAWERFGNLLNTAEGDGSKRVWRFERFDRLEVVVTAGGKPVTDAEVTLYSGRDSAWAARTNREGKAYVFTGMFAGRAAQGDYTVEVRSGPYSKTTNPLQIPQQGSVKVDLGQSEATPDQADIMFLVDTTGSMEDELNYLEAELKDVVKRVVDGSEGQVPLRLSANFYRDVHDDYVVRSFPFTTNVNEVISQFSKQSAQGGGDYPEAVEEGLREAIREHDWSENARARLLFLVLDAPPHAEPQVIDELHKLIEEAARQGIRIIPVAASGTNVDTEYLLRFMAAATGGTYLFLTDDSGIGGDHLEPAVGEYEVKKLNDQLVEVINRYVQ